MSEIANAGKLNETDSAGAAPARVAAESGASNISQAESPRMPVESETGAERDESAQGERGESDAQVFLARLHPTVALAETTTYAPGPLIAILFLLPPVGATLVVATLILVFHIAPIWLALTPLIWLPIFVMSWLALPRVRLAPNLLAIGRPLQRWRVIPFGAISRLETRGGRLSLITRTGRISFTPSLLARGGELRRQLLLSLPLGALSNEARAEASYLLEGAFAEASEEEALRVQTALWLRGAMLALAMTLAIADVATFSMLSAPEAGLLLLGVEIVAALVYAWLWQPLVINARGLGGSIIGQTTWDDLKSIRRAPGELALILSGRRLLILPGPALFSRRDAHRVRQVISFYIRERGLMTAPHQRF